MKKNIFIIFVLLGFLFVPVYAEKPLKDHTSTFSSTFSTDTTTFVTFTTTSFTANPEPPIIILALGVKHNAGKIDFGTAASPIQAGWVRLSNVNLYSSAVGWGWNVTMASVDRGAGDGINDDLTRDMHWSGAARVFSIHVNAGEYNWTLHHGDTFATASWDLYLNGTLIEADITTGGSVWENITGTVAVTEWMNFTMTDLNGGVKWNGIEFGPSTVQYTTVATTIYSTVCVTSCETSTMSEYLVNGTTVSTTSDTSITECTTLYSTTSLGITLISVDETITVVVTHSGDEGFFEGLEPIGGNWNFIVIITILLCTLAYFIIRRYKK